MAQSLNSNSKLPVKMLVVLWLVGWTLRVPILSAPPLSTLIADSFHLGEAGVGALTMLPVIALALGAIPSAWFIGKYGIRFAITGGILIMVAASVARGYVPTTLLLFIVSILMGLGVSLFQTALPAATRVWTPTHTALGSAVYLNGMMLGELSGAGLTLPLILPLAGDNWSMALVLWSIPIVFIALLAWLLPQGKPNSTAAYTKNMATESSLPKFNDAKVWQYGILLASSIIGFFIVNTYIALLLQSREESNALEGMLLAYNATPLLASFVVLARPKWIGYRGPIAISSMLAIIGLAGLVFFTGWVSWLFAVVNGCAATVQLILLISLPPAIAKGIAVTRLSAAMTLIGFSFAFVLTILGGWLADWLNWTEMALIPSLVFMTVALFALGRVSRYPRYS